MNGLFRNLNPAVSESNDVELRNVFLWHADHVHGRASRFIGDLHLRLVRERLPHGQPWRSRYAIRTLPHARCSDDLILLVGSCNFVMSQYVTCSNPRPPATTQVKASLSVFGIVSIVIVVLLGLGFCVTMVRPTVSISTR